MTAAVLAGGACALILAALARPFLAAGHGSTGPSADHDEAAEPLLRQLHDLDEDLAAGRVLEADYRRVRRRLEAQAAEATPGGRAGAVPAHPTRRTAASPAHRPGASRRRRRRVGIALGLLVTVVAAVVVSTLLASQVTTSRTATAAPASGVESTGAAGARPGRSIGAPTTRQLAAVEAATEAVRRHPRRAVLHVALAQAYAEVGQAQLAAVEYLAATRLDPGNAAANTALAMVAFRAGSVARADSLVSQVLVEHPDYPEALYTRGLIRAMGLHRPRAAMRDLQAYDHAAPYGSHRTTVATVLALLRAGAIR